MKWFFYLVFSLQLTAIALSFFRLWKGPGGVDRVMIFDLLAAVGISLMLAASVFFNSQLFLDVAILMALVSFAGTIGFAYFLEKEKSL